MMPQPGSDHFREMHQIVSAAPTPTETDFPFDSIDGEADPEIVDQIFADCMAWLFSYVLSGSGKLKTRGAESVAFRRFLALAYIYRPDLLRARTIREIAGELGVSKQAVNKFISKTSLDLDASGINQREIEYRVKCRTAQIKAAIKRNLNRVE